MMKTYKYKPLLLTFLFATQYIYGAQLPNVLERWEKALETCNILEIESLTSDPNIDIDVNKGIGSAQKSPLEIVIEGDSPEAPEAVQLLVKKGANVPQEGIDSLILAVLNKVSCNDCKNQVRFELLTWGFLRRQKNICLPGSLYCLIHQFRMDDEHYIEIMKFLLSLKPPQNVYNSDVFSDVIKTENLRICELFTKQRPTPTTKYGRETLLHTLALQGGSKKFTEGLLRQFKDQKEVLNKANNTDETAVKSALLALNLRCAKQLMRAGAKFPNTNIGIYFRQTSFNPYPCNHLKLSKFFAEYDPDLIDPSGKTLLHYLASGSNYFRIKPTAARGELDTAVEILTKSTFNPLNRQDSKGKTPLHLVVANRLPYLCALFILKGANSQIRDRKGKKPLDHIRAEDIIHQLCTQNQLCTQLIKDLLEAIESKDIEAVKTTAREIFSDLKPLKYNSEELIEEYLRREKK